MSVTRTAKGTAQSKTSVTNTLTIASVALTAGDLLVVSLAYDDVTLASVTWGTQQLTLQTAVLGAGVRTRLAWCVVGTSGTQTITATWGSPPTAKVMVASVYHSSLTGAVPNAGEETNNTGTGTAASTPASNPIVGGTDSVLVGVVGTEGPSGDTAGTWATPNTNGQRIGTTGNPAASNVTVSEAYQLAPTAGSTPALSKTGMTSRDWGAELQGFYWAVSSTTVSGTFTADSVLKKTTSGSFTADSVLKKTTSGSFTADAVLARVLMNDTFTRTVSNGLGTSPEGFAYRSHPAAQDHDYDPNNLVSVDGTQIVAGTSTEDAYSGYPMPPSGVIQFDFKTPTVDDEWSGIIVDGPLGITGINGFGFYDGYEVHAHVFPNGDMVVDASGSVSSFVPEAEIQHDTWYTLKVAYTTVTPRTAWIKVWVRGAAEPDWMSTGSIDTLPAVGGFGSGGPPPTRRFHIQTSTIPTDGLFIDNLIIATTTTDPWTVEYGITADAVLASSASTVGGSFTANAVIKKTVSVTLSANAVLRRATSGLFTADAVLASTVGATFTADAVLAGASSSLTTYAEDQFERTVSNGFGTADTGGSWTMVGTSSLFSVGSGVGKMAVAAGSTLRGNLLSVSAQDVEAIVLFGSDQFSSTASGISGYIETRYVTSTNHYRVRLQFNNGGAVYLGLDAGQNGAIIAPTLIARETRSNVSDLFWIKFQTEGTNPTTLRAKVWKDGTAEPGSWDLTATDSTAAMQTAGAVGLRCFVGSVQSPSPVNVTFDHFTVTSIPTGATTVSQTFTADSVLKATALATFTADSVLKSAVSGSWTADARLAVISAVSFTSNAVIKAPVGGAFTAQSVLRVTIPITSTADAVIKASVAIAFTADAVIIKTVSGTFTADSVLRTTSAATYTANAVLRKTVSGTFTGNAVLRTTVAGSFAANAVIKTPTPGFITSDSVLLATVSSTFTADAVLSSGTVTQSRTFVADSVIKVPTPASFTSDAVIKNTVIFGHAYDNGQYDDGAYENGGPTADAVIKAPVPSTFTANAVIRGPISQTFSADARLLVISATTFAANAVLRGTATSSFFADAIIKSPINGNFSANAVIKAPVGGSFTANAVIKSPVSSTFTANAYLVNLRTSSFSADAILRGSVSSTFTADAYLIASTSGTFSADSVLRRTEIGSFIADAALQRAASGTWTGAAVIKKSIAGTFTADAILRGTLAGSFAGDAVINQTVPVTFTADAYLGSVTSSAFTADARLLVPVVGTFTGDAVIKAAQTGSFTANAVLRSTLSGTFSADAIIKSVVAATINADAVIRAPQSTTFTVDSVLLGIGASAFSADAILLAPMARTFTADAVLRVTTAGTFNADARISVVGTPVWTTPGNQITINDLTPTLAFNMPTETSGDMYFEMQLDTVDTFDSPDLLTFLSDEDAGWEIWDGAAWVTMPVPVPASYAGNEARFTIPAPLAQGVWFRRVRGGV